MKFRTDGRVMGRDIVLDYVLRLGEMVEWRVEFNAVRSVRVNYSPRVIFEVDGRRMGKCLSLCLFCFLSFLMLRLMFPVCWGLNLMFMCWNFW